MKFEVLKPFAWAGQDLVAGDTVEIPDESSRIGALTRSKFIRFAGEDGRALKATELPTAKEVAQEIAVEPIGIAPAVAVRDPKTIVREAKAKAAAKR